MSVRSGFPLLLLLLLLVWKDDTRVHCQTLDESRVSTDYVEIVWKRSHMWLGVATFNVVFTSTDSNVCEEMISCHSPICRFNSLQVCGVVSPCTETTTSVSGGNYSALPITLVTAPDPVTNLILNLEEGVEYITWNNPSIDSSPCHEDTAVRIVFNGQTSTSYHEIDEEYQSKDLCVEGSGSVEVWTRGGGGESNVSSSPFVYNGSSVVHLVKVQSCEPLGCTGLQVAWTYLPVCLDVAFFEVEVDNHIYDMDINSTNITITGLQSGKMYVLCVSAVNGDRERLDSYCVSCYTAEDMVENLNAVALNATSLNVTWDPPLCPREPDITYYIDVRSSSSITSLSTKENSKVVESLYDFHYKVCVETNYKACTTAFTLLEEPYSLQIHDLSSNSIEVQWSYYTDKYLGYNIVFEVTWGIHLQHKGFTQVNSFIIDDYNSTQEVEQVCVAAFPKDMEDLKSDVQCDKEEQPPSKADGPDYLPLFIFLGVFLGVALVIVLSLVVLFKRHRQALKSAQ